MKLPYNTGTDERGKYIEVPALPMINDTENMAQQIARYYVDTIDMAILVEMPTELLQNVIARSTAELKRREGIPND